jgi:hypothetical protein
MDLPTSELGPKTLHDFQRSMSTLWACASLRGLRGATYSTLVRAPCLKFGPADAPRRRASRRLNSRFEFASPSSVWRLRLKISGPEALLRLARLGATWGRGGFTTLIRRATHLASLTSMARGETLHSEAWSNQSLEPTRVGRPPLAAQLQR